MVITVNRNSGVFEKNVADELNKSFATINKKIDETSWPDLAYKEDVQLLGTNTNSFRSGHLICIRDHFTIKKKFDKFTEVGTINVSVPYDVWCTGVTDNNEPLLCHITSNKVYAYGILSYYPQDLHLSTDIVLPHV